MSANTADFPRVRLLAAGCLSIVLLGAIVFFDPPWDEVVGYVPACHRGLANPTGMLVTAALSLLTLTVLAPVLFRCRGIDRWSAALLAIFPLLMFVVAVLWVL